MPVQALFQIHPVHEVFEIDLAWPVHKSVIVISQGLVRNFAAFAATSSRAPENSSKML
jgi:hypothetical protein